MFDKFKKSKKKWNISAQRATLPDEENEKKTDPDPLAGLWTTPITTLEDSDSDSDQDSDDSDQDCRQLDPFFEYQFRIILIGDAGVGKSSLLRSFTDGTFFEYSDPTVGVDFFSRVIKVQDGSPIKLQLWDTAGHERFRSITRSYYRNSVGCLLVFDVCNRDSLKHLVTWMKDAKRFIEPHKAVFILVGSKEDSEQNRQVSESEARAFAHSNNIPAYIETSSKTGYRVDECFKTLSQSIYEKIQNGEYPVDGAWDGIKRGYYGSLAPGRNSLHQSFVNLLEAKAEKKLCC